MHPDVEQSVHRFNDIARELIMPLTQDLILERALLVEEKLLKANDMSDDTRKRLSAFSAYVGWCREFLKRQSMKSVSLSGEGASAAVEQAAESM